MTVRASSSISFLSLLFLLALSSCDFSASLPPVSDTYTVTYLDNGSTSGNVPKDTTKYKTGAKATVRDNTGNLAKPGFVFASWNTKADGTGSGYFAGAKLTIEASDVTLYAQWAAQTTALTPLVGVYSNSTVSGVVNTLETVTLTSSGLTDAFVDTQSQSGAQLGSTVMVLSLVSTVSTTATAADVVLKVDSATATGTRAGGPSVTGSFVRASLSLNGTSLSFARSNGVASTEDGAKELPLASPATFVPGSSGTPTPPTGSAYHVYYDGNDADSGEPPVDSTPYAAGDQVWVAENTGNLTKDLATFAGWNTEADGTGTHYDADGSATFNLASADVTLYAQWDTALTPFVGTWSVSQSGGEISSTVSIAFTNDTATLSQVVTGTSAGSSIQKMRLVSVNGASASSADIVAEVEDVQLTGAGQAQLAVGQFTRLVLSADGDSLNLSGSGGKATAEEAATATAGALGIPLTKQ